MIRALRRGGIGAGIGLVTMGSIAAGQSLGAGVAAVAIGNDPAFVGLGPSFRWIASRQVGLVGLVALGGRDGAVAGRGELAAQFRLPPRGGRGPTWYFAGGAAGIAARFGRSGGYLTAGVGVEAPSGRHGRGEWVAEIGVGGGIRAMAGFRLRMGGRKRQTAARSRRPSRLLHVRATTRRPSRRLRLFD